MEKEELQNQELNQASGGAIDPLNTYRQCLQCKSVYSAYDDYPKGYLLRTESIGCGNHTYYYKCPNCGHEWKE